MSTVNVPIRTAAEAGAWLEGLINHERLPNFRYERLGLEPIRRLLERLGNPERGLSIVHVAGSKGKGSTCLFAEAILRAAGERVGVFTSPHFERWTERFRIDASEVADEDLADAVESVRPHVEALRADEATRSPTFFDATTAVGLLLFARANVDRVLLEVGLGGRLDSTNAVDPAVTVITQIELEHTDKLGGTLAAIAGEKAGIIKPGVPCVIGALAPEADRVVAERAMALGASVARLGRDFFVLHPPAAGADGLDGGRPRRRRFTYREPGIEIDGLSLRVLGRHQIDNAAIATAAIRRLDAHDPIELGRAVRSGLATVALPGRLEVMSERPWVVVDAAHTEASARELALVLAERRVGRRHLLLSISRDKDPTAILVALAAVCDELWLTRSEPIRSLDPEVIAEIAARCTRVEKIHCIEDPREAVRAAHASLSPDDALCCAGSIYLAGAARGALRAIGVEREEHPTG